MTGRHRLVIVEIHVSRSIEKIADTLCRNAEVRSEQTRKVFSIEGGGEREHGVVETDVLKLNDVVSNFLVPIPPATLQHAGREAMQRDVKNMAFRTSKPRGQATEFVVLLQQ